MTTHHVCCEGTLLCSGVNPCRPCLDVHNKEVLAEAMRKTSLYFLQTRGDHGSVMMHELVRPPSQFWTVFFGFYEECWRLLHENMMADPEMARRAFDLRRIPPEVFAQHAQAVNGFGAPPYAQPQAPLPPYAQMMQTPYGQPQPQPSYAQPFPTQSSYTQGPHSPPQPQPAYVPPPVPSPQPPQPPLAVAPFGAMPFGVAAPPPPPPAAAPPPPPPAAAPPLPPSIAAAATPVEPPVVSPLAAAAPGVAPTFFGGRFDEPALEAAAAADSATSSDGERALDTGGLSRPITVEDIAAGATPLDEPSALLNGVSTTAPSS